MDDQASSHQIAEKVVQDIHKDFVVVGKHRLHGWYAWAILGIVVGMFAGVAYVANRSNQSAFEFLSSDAASKKNEKYPVISASGNFDAVYPILKHESKDAVWIAGSPSLPVAPIAPHYPLIKPIHAPAGHYIKYLISPNKTALSAVAVKGSGLYFAKLGPASNLTPYIDINRGPDADVSKAVTYTLRGVYVKEDGNDAKKNPRIPVSLNGTFYCGIDLPQSLNSGCDNRGRSFSLSNGKIIVPNGVPFYTDVLEFTLSGDKLRKVKKNIILPAGGGDITVIIRKDGVTGKYYVSRVHFTGTETDIDINDTETDGEASTEPTPATTTPY